MTKRVYGQYCGLARAMEIVGERWALLIVRDLLVAPKRYTDLRRGLPRIPTNILATRLKELEQAGVVRRRILPRPDGSIVYELTEYGCELEDAVLALGRWGVRSLGDPRPGEVLTSNALITALRAAFRPDAAGDPHVGYELRMGEVVVHARIAGRRLELADGALPGADLVIETGPVIRAVLAGELSPAEAVANGSVKVAGDPRLFTRFADTFQIGRWPG